MFDPFQYFKPSEERLVTIAIVREAYRTCLAIVEEQCPNSREKSIAITELETSAMWAVKSVVIQDFKPVPPVRPDPLDAIRSELEHIHKEVADLWKRR